MKNYWSKQLLPEENTTSDNPDPECRQDKRSDARPERNRSGKIYTSDGTDNRVKARIEKESFNPIIGGEKVLLE